MEYVKVSIGSSLSCQGCVFGDEGPLCFRPDDLECSDSGTGEHFIFKEKKEEENAS